MFQHLYAVIQYDQPVATLYEDNHKVQRFERDCPWMLKKVMGVNFVR